MADFPVSPLPSSVSAPALIDPILRFRADSGHEVRRAMTARPRRRYTVSYLGKRTDELHTLVDFIQQVRNGALDFAWPHPTAVDVVTLHATTPVWLTYPAAHGLSTGQSIIVWNTVPDTALEGQHYVITRANATQIYLEGTTSVGAGTAAVAIYLPHATLRLPEDTWPEPTKLIGPEQGTVGRWSLSVTIEEVF